MSILFKWKDAMADFGLEPTSVPTLKEIKPYYRKLSLLKHPDKFGGNNDQQVKLNNNYELFKNQDQAEAVQKAFNNYLHSNTDKYFANVDISVEGNELLLGELYYAFGLDSF
jgi:DnaJ-class molecular chaperone